MRSCFPGHFVMTAHTWLCRPSTHGFLRQSTPLSTPRPLCKAPKAKWNSLRLPCDPGREVLPWTQQGWSVSRRPIPLQTAGCFAECFLDCASHQCLSSFLSVSLFPRRGLPLLTRSKSQSFSVVFIFAAFYLERKDPI